MSNTVETDLLESARKGDLNACHEALKSGAFINCVDNNDRSALFLAAENGHVNIIRFLIEQGADVFLSDSQLVSPFMQAAKNNNHDACLALLDCYETEDLDGQVDRYGENALMYAVASSNREIVNAIIAKGASGATDTEYGQSAVMTAAIQGDYDLVKDLLAAGANPSSTHDTGYTLLMLVVSDKGLVKFLLDNGVSPNEGKTEKGETALIFAAGNGDEEIVQLLLDAGADKDCLDNKGKSAADYSSERGHNHLSALLTPTIKRPHDPKLDAKLFFEIEANNLEHAQKWLLEGADSNAVNHEGHTALYHSIYERREASVEMVKLLVEYGANPNTVDKQSEQSPLELAAFSGLYAVAELLLNCGAKVNEVDGTVSGALIWAIQGMHLEVAKLLLSAGANINGLNQFGETALNKAADQRYAGTEIVRELLAHGANPNEVAKNKPSPLSKMVFHLQSVEQMLACGADPNLTIGDTTPPLLNACENDDASVASLLFQHGAQLDAQDGLGRSALHVSLMRGKMPLFDWLLEVEAPVNLRDEYDEVPLHFAVSNADAVKKLIVAGVELDVQNDTGITPLIKAAQFGWTESAILLLDAGAKIDVCDEDGHSAVDYAAADWNIDLIQAMIGRGTSRTPVVEFVFSVIEGKLEQAKKMAQALPTSSLEEVFTGAAGKGMLEEIRFLLSLGVNVNAGTGEQETTALINAASNGHTGTVRLLLENNADMNQVNSYQQTARSYASRDGHQDVIDILDKEEIKRRKLRRKRK